MKYYYDEPFRKLFRVDDNERLESFNQYYAEWVGAYGTVQAMFEKGNIEQYEISEQHANEIVEKCEKEKIKRESKPRKPMTEEEIKRRLSQRAAECWMFKDDDDD